jgi:protein-S-isoprenylcysteine O-methyltransferase Ste14
MQRLIPFSFPRGIFTLVFISAGVLAITVGIVLVVLTRQEFARYGQPTDPGQSTSEMITTGVFSTSRNPLYLGGVILLAGISLAFNIPWALILLLLSIIACHFILIAPEEKYLAAKFGEKYHLYTATVHRWFGRKRKLD